MHPQVVTKDSCFSEFWTRHQQQYAGWDNGPCPTKYDYLNEDDCVCGDDTDDDLGCTNVLTRKLGIA